MFTKTAAGGAFATLRQASLPWAVQRRAEFMLRRSSFALGRFAGLPLQRKLLYAEVGGRLVVAWGLVRLVPFKRWKSHLEESPAVRRRDQLTSQDLANLKDMQHVLRQFKWGTRDRATCLMMVLVARWMLNRRRIPGTIFLGVRRDADKPGLHAHAWMSSEVGVVGHENIDEFAVVEHFGESFVVSKG